MSDPNATRIAPAPTPFSPTVAHAPTNEPGSDQTIVQAHSPTHPSEPGATGFTMTREIARGGMGVVFAAHDPTFDRQVAVKVMRHGQDADRFVVEAKVTAQLPHPGIPPVYALGTLPDGRPFLAMKLIEGRTLAEELKHTCATDLPHLLGVFEQICQTVGFAHSKGIIHRDLKPANVMVGAFGEVLVMDWGLAKELRSADCGLRTEGAGSDGPSCSSNPHSAIHNPQSHGGQVKGTPAYMAPEQARGEKVDARADVFALGGILAVILTGKPPFSGDTVLDTVKQAARAETTECFAQLGACGADAELVALAKTCLAAEPVDRFATAADVAAAVAAYRAGVEERLRKAERDRAVSAAEAREQRKRRKVQLVLVVGVALFLAAGGGVAWYSDRQAAERQRKEELAEADRKAQHQREEAERKADLDRIAAERQAGEARLMGERDAEKRLKAQQAQQGVAANLVLAADLRRQYKFKEAGAALGQAADLARSGAPELLGAIGRERENLAFVVALDGIRFRKWIWIAEEGAKGHFNTTIAAPEYRTAFAAHGLDLPKSDPAEAAKLIASSPIRVELVAAVDDWALYEPDDAVRDHLLVVARKADRGDWTDRLRDPAVWGDAGALKKLAAEADPAATSSAALSVLSNLMERKGLDPSPLLSAARAKHPTDFELAFVLGRWSDRHRKDGQGLGPYEAARALRPDNVTVWINLGVILHGRGEMDGALAAWREAVRLDPRDPLARYNLGWGLQIRGDLDGAIAAYREVIRLDPKYALAHYNLAGALNDKGDVTGAIATWWEAVRHDPDNARAHTNLAAAYAQQQKYPDAITCARAAIRADPKYANAHVVLGLVLLQTGDLPGARAALTEAARLDREKWGPLLAKLPPLTVAPPPHEVKP
jgi:tetratricopeptide (TPR) repeat protein